MQELAESHKLCMRSAGGTDEQIAAITLQTAAHSTCVTGSARGMIQGWQQQLHQHQHGAQQLLDGWQQKLDDMARQLDAF